MVPQQQGQQTDKPQEQKVHLPLWVRWMIVILVFLIIAIGATFWILNTQGPLATAISIIFVALGLVFSFFQVLPLFLSTRKSDVPTASPSQPTHIIVHVPSNPLLAQQSALPSQTVPLNVLEVLPKGELKNAQQHEPSITETDAVKSIRHDRPRVDWGEAPHLVQFYGREQELGELEQWIVSDHCRMLAILGMGGVGKTSLAAKLAEHIEDEFEYVFWRELKNAPPLESIVKSCIQFLSNQQRIDLPEDRDGQIAVLMEYLRDHRCLLVLDNMETILQAGNRTGQYREGYEGYGRLIRRIGEAKHQSCLLLTSREKPKEIALLEGDASVVRSCRLEGLQASKGREILRDKGLRGAEEMWNALIDRYTGNPLALKLAAQFIREVFDGEIAGFLKDGGMIFSDIRDVLDQQFERLSELEQEIMYWLAIEREAVSLDGLQEDIMHPMARGALLEALKSLRQRSMIESSGAAGFTLQSVIMEYVTDRLIEQMTEELDTETIWLFGSHALIKAQVKDYVRESQVRLILTPVAQRLLPNLGKEGLEKRLKSILRTLREADPQKPNYAAGNTLNLLVQLGCDLRGYDFSHLVVRQAYLRGVTLPEVNFSYADLATSIFTDTFGSILSVAFSPNGERLVAGTANGEIRLWQVTSGMPLLTFKGHTDWVRSVAFSLDGKVVASGSQDQTVLLWDVSTGQCLKTLQGHTNRIRSVAFSPDRKTLASGSEDQTVRLWDISTGQCLKVLQGHTNRVNSVTFSPDGKTVASGSDDQTMWLWDVSTGQCLNILQGHTNCVRSVAFSSDGKTVASGSEDRTVRLWDVSTGQCLKTVQGHTDQVESVAFTSNGKTLASGSEDRTVRLWDVSTGQCLKTLQGHTNRVRSVAFSSDGKAVASGSEDQTVWLWDVSTGQCLNILQGYSRWVESVAFSPDGKIVASGSEDRTVRLWDINTGQSLKTLQGHTHWVNSVAFSPDGKVVASGSQDQTVWLWDVSTGQRLNILQGHTNRVWSVAFSPDGKIIASGSEDRTVRLWDVSTGQRLKTLQGHTDRIRSVAFSPDGKVLASGSKDQTVRLWDISTEQCLKVLQGHTNRVNSVTFSPDGKTVASGSEDRTVRLWDVSTGQCLNILQGHTNRVWSVAFSPDGETVASGSEDGTIKLWDIQTGECLKTLRSDRPYERMNVTGMMGLTKTQKATLRALGAVEDD